MALPKDTYSPGESVWVEVDVSISPSKDLSSGNFILLNGETPISITKVTQKITDYKYLFYFSLPTTLNAGEYTLKLKDIEYVKDGKIEKGIFSTTFNVVSSNETLYVWPPVFYSEFFNMEDPFFTKIILENRGTEHINITISTSNDLVTSIVPFKFKMIVDSPYYTSLRTDITDYNKVIYTSYITYNANGKEYVYPLVLKKKYYNGAFSWDDTLEIFNESEDVNNTLVNDTVVNDTKYLYPTDGLLFIDPVHKSVEQTLTNKSPILESDWVVKNFAEKPLHNITINLTGFLSEIVKYEFLSNTSEVAAGGELSVRVTLTPNSSSRVLYEGNLIISAAEGINDSIPFNVKFVPFNESDNSTSIQYGENNNNNSLTNYTEIYHGDVKVEASSSAWIVIIVIVIIIALIGIIFWRKSKPKKSEMDTFLSNLRRK